MLYLIDANNLAGKMDILGNKDFDLELFRIVSQYAYLKSKKVILVFDGCGQLWSSYGGGQIRVIYAGDCNYSSADEKIVDMVRTHKHPEGYTVITDDSGIRGEIEAIAERKGKKITIVSASHFAKKIADSLKYDDDDEIDNDKELGDDEIKEINDELMKIWKE